MAQRYLIALGSNRRHPHHGSPERVIAAAARALGQADVKVLVLAPVMRSAPLGPSLRRYANAAAVVRTHKDPAALLRALKRIERQFGRRQGGQRWTARVLDLDIVLWSGGAWVSPDLIIPHPAFRERAFVLGPARAIAPHWRDPMTGLTVQNLAFRRLRPVRCP
ncbi:2-amino-4-hydroxy-6-hydroxymethyldihydropteridine diphosphokinase [Novosphingobium aquiterrae]|uniref:2-amino-4-hydroxy-6-hydroxymethyldihydropteridine pyrophosphokinase n=1 Tax=Novosphingobium aquiterrae TaxID=624388 RepID=A0ABV6PFJ3_9SPHN